jgi:hypothetical protein
MNLLSEIMRVLLLTICFVPSLLVMAQETNKNQIENLNKAKQRLESVIKVKQDSLILINQQIDRFTQENLFSKLKARSGGMVFKATIKMSGKIRKDSNPNAVVLTLVNENDTVLLTDFIDDYWIVNKGPYFGYINEMFINKTPDLKTFKDAIYERTGRMALKMEEEKTEREKAALEKRTQERMDRLIKKYGKENGERISNGEYWIGMSPEMATESLGNPETINHSVGSWGVNEQWVYPSLYLYFDNGVLTSYQSSNRQFQKVFEFT